VSLSSLKHSKLHVYLCLWPVPSLLTCSSILNVQNNRFSLSLSFSLFSLSLSLSLSLCMINVHYLIAGFQEIVSCIV